MFTTITHQYFSNRHTHYNNTLWVFLQNVFECERGKQDFSNNVLVFNATSVLIFQYKKASKSRLKNSIQLVYFNYYKGKSAKEIANMFSLKIRAVYNIISRAKKELVLKGPRDRPKKSEAAS